jgi:hypothetical protein
VDYQALLYGPSQLVFGSDALLQINGTRYPVRAIDKTSGVDVGEEIKGQTILPAAVIRAPELLAQGRVLTDLADKPSFNLNGVWYRVISYRMKPSPRGELDGEIYLILEKAPILPLSTATIPPPAFVDDGGLLPPLLEVFWSLETLIVDIDPLFGDAGCFRATMTVTTDMAAALADENGFAAQEPEIAFPENVLGASFVDSATVTAILSVGSRMSAAFADDTGLSAQMLVTSRLSASFTDDLGFAASAPLLGLNLGATFRDDLGVATAALSVAFSLQAALADDLGISKAVLTSGVPINLSASLADDLGVSRAIVTTSNVISNVSFLQNNVALGFNSTSHTFSGVNIGAADTKRIVMVLLGALGQSGGNTVVSSVTIGGVAATLTPAGSSGKCTVACAYAVVPTGTTANVVVNFTGTASQCFIATYRMISPSALNNYAGFVANPGGFTASTASQAVLKNDLLMEAVFISANNTSPSTSISLIGVGQDFQSETLGSPVTPWAVGHSLIATNSTLSYGFSASNMVAGGTSDFLSLFFRAT